MRHHRTPALAAVFLLFLFRLSPLEAQDLLDGLAGGGAGAAKGRVSWKVTVEPKEVQRGEKAEVVAEYTVEPGWWIYAPDHKADSGKPTAVTIESPVVEVSGAPTFPAPDVKREPLLNETHRILKKTGAIRVPFTVKKDALPGESKLTVKAEYMACNDVGCDLPKKPAFDVAVMISGAPPVEAAPAPENAGAPAVKQDGHAAWKVIVEPKEVQRGEKAEVVAEYTVEPGWWIYAPDHKALAGQATKVTIESPWVEAAGDPRFPEPEVKNEPVLNETHRILKKTGAIRQPFTVKKDASPGDLALAVKVSYMACNEQTCDLPKEPSFEVVVKVSDAPAAAAEDPIATAGLLAFIFLMIGGGLFTLIMPCTYPMIPITISYFTKQADARGGKIMGLALAYGAGIILIFNVIGLVFAETIGPIAFNPWVNLVFAVAFVVFAFALFGLFELRLPSSMSTFASKASGTGGYLGVFLLGVVLVVTSFTCTAPILGTLLRYAVEVRDPGRVLLGMTAFGTTVAAPFVLLSLFPAKLRSLPRAGEWMHVVKVSLGYLELAAALKLLSQADLGWKTKALPRELFLVLWAAIFVVLGLYLLSVFRMKDEAAAGVSPIRMLFGLGSIFAAAYFFYGAMGYRLDWIMETMAPPYRASIPAGGAAVRGAREAGTKWTIVEDDFEAGIARALQEKKPALINFTGHT